MPFSLRIAVLALLAASPWRPLLAQETSPHRFVLTSAASNTQTDDFGISQRTLDDTGSQPWSVRKHSLHGGKQDGCQLITVDNGKLQIVLIPTRGLSILEVRSGDLRLGWESPVKEVVNPQHVRLDTRGGLGWLEGFNEFMVRCGLEFAGQAGKDEFIDNTGAKAEMTLTLHGKIGNIPASEVEVLVERRPPHRIRVRGVVHERSFYGPKLELATELWTEPGSSSFKLADTVTNHGGSPQEYTLIYHVNYGQPLLGAGAKVVLPARRVTPMNAHAAQGVEDYATYAGPTLNFIEQVYLIEPLANAQGQTAVLLHNAARDRGASLRWTVSELPCFTLWKNTAAMADGYVTGLEPGTSHPYNRKVERKMGRLPKLAAGQSKRFEVEFGLHATAAEVSTVANQIAEIQGAKQPQLDREPPKVE